MFCSDSSCLVNSRLIEKENAIFVAPKTPYALRMVTWSDADGDNEDIGGQYEWRRRREEVSVCVSDKMFNVESTSTLSLELYST